MKIRIQLNQQSIKDAIKQLNAVKNKIPKMLNELLEKCADWIIKRANENLALYSGVGINVIQDIGDAWTYDIVDGRVKIINSSNKAAYVEFGIGIVGESDPHPAASAAGYEYNMPSDYKDEQGSWHFFSNEADLDIPEEALEWGWDSGKDDPRHRMHIYTRGTEGSMFAYNALMDLITTKQVDVFWNEIKERYIG